mmetsp:Transcript_2317/g.4302  ORF Transcript_2317/g.4302 Transcript_2317/m.4302 type:complete len:793 (-) Transcript_2317:59-2437(-)
MASSTGEEDDDLFASLGNSLMRDLLADISGPGSSASDGDMFEALANLEKQLDSSSSSSNNINGSGGGIRDSLLLGGKTGSHAFLPPGLMAPSAGAIVVGQTAAATNTSTTTASPGATSMGQDAFSQSLQQFSAMKLADDFLKADSARKEQLQNVKEVSDNVVNNLFQGEEEDLEDYDVEQDVIWKRKEQQQMQQDVAPPKAQLPPPPPDSSSKQPPPPPPPPLQVLQQPPPMAFAPHGMGGNYPPNPSMFSSHGMPQPNPPSMHPIMSMAPHPMHPHPHYHPYPFAPGGPPPPPHVLMGMQGPMPMPPGSVMPMSKPGTLPPMSLQQPQKQQHQMMKRNEDSPLKENPSEKSIFNKMDFPALGADESEVEMERQLELERAKELKEKRDAVAANTRQSQGSSRREHIIFDNASLNAAPIPATAIICTSMTSRDLCYVIHSILRPLLSFSSVLDAYNADYYRWSYDDRKSRNLLFLGGATPSSNGNQNLPAPVWKETKMKAQEMEDQFRQKVEQRADEWSKEKQALGRVVKVNIKRPRALLSTTALSSNVEKDLDGSEENFDTDEDRQRVVLWASRAAIDKGYQSYLNLVELRRLLQSRPGDTWSGEDSVVNRREELLKEVEDNVSKLQASFGLKKSGVLLECDDKFLSRTLMLPKGRMLLSRVIDEGVLPHSSACKVLPSAMKIIFDSAFNSELAAAPPAGEDRLLRSLVGLVKTLQPSVDPVNLLSCLDSTTLADSSIRGEKRTMKSVLTSKRTLMELLYAIFSRGGEVCVGDFEKDWKEKESKFLAILSQN